MPGSLAAKQSSLVVEHCLAKPVIGRPFVRLVGSQWRIQSHIILRESDVLSLDRIRHLSLPTGNRQMVIRAGREFLAIPGPTTMPDEVLRAMHRPALDIYSDEMVGMTDSLLRDLSKLFATKGQSYIANGHGAWE